MSGLRFAYVTNGLGDHRLDDALRMLADHGYAGVGLTLDHHHLDPLGPDLPRKVSVIADRLRDLGLAVVVETGGRFVLDPRRKHEPTLLSDDGRERRVEFLRIAVRVAADLGAEAVSLWSGARRPPVGQGIAWRRLLQGCESVLHTAEPLGVKLAFEPEPGMFISSVSDWQALHDELNHHLFGLTLDIGHCLVTERHSIPQVIASVRDDLTYVQIDDMRTGVHEHLNFGAGDVDFPPVLQALADFDGLVAVELSRHSHRAHETVPGSIDFLRAQEHA
ncbi:sugar phosphate isomerase/epimerase family protein [Kineosporia sp. NBRC 101731]|uniref:sugar phosphate isomerase/epimerase family protein n=1 Tax=Kineosporia sp. NBRC 101731 TaxID=3032199 RepID=UPI0024A12BC6|nr:sugar phosphate isomerase/epimerase family protein [Kineosporia sp. NBRC 101731]GLY31304.1 xylose isomerase [Kineosporia sp. NBRC 101731]